MSQYDHYRKSVAHLQTIDVYRVLDLFGVTNPAVQHSIKKLLCAGQRGGKDMERDLREAHDSIGRALQMLAEDCSKAAEKQPPYATGGMLGSQDTPTDHVELVMLVRELRRDVQAMRNGCVEVVSE